MAARAVDKKYKCILNKSENATPELSLFIYKMVQDSKANESESEYSKTGLCITVKKLADVVTRKHTKVI